MGIHLAVQPAELLPRPFRHAGKLVVDKNAAIFHFRFAGSHISISLDVCRLPPPHRHVGPPVPRRHAQPARQLIDAINRAALVAPGNHQGTRHARRRVVHHGYHEALPLAIEVFRPQDAALHHVRHQGIASQRANNDRQRGSFFQGHAGRTSRHPQHVFLQVANGAHHSGMFIPVITQCCHLLRGHQREIPVTCLADHKILIRKSGPNGQEQSTPAAQSRHDSDYLHVSVVLSHFIKNQRNRATNPPPGRNLTCNTS